MPLWSFFKFFHNSSQHFHRGITHHWFVCSAWFCPHCDSQCYCSHWLSQCGQNHTVTASVSNNTAENVRINLFTKKLKYLTKFFCAPIFSRPRTLSAIYCMRHYYILNQDPRAGRRSTLELYTHVDPRRWSAYRVYTAFSRVRLLRG